MFHRFDVPSTKNIFKNVAKYRPKIPKRFVIVAMVFFGYGNIFYLHTNLAMAVVEMTSPKNITDLDGNVALEPEFKWNSKQKGLVLSTFSYGRLLGPIGGILAGRIGGATLFGMAIFVTAVVTLSTPYLLYNNFGLFVIANVILGIFEAFQYASISQLWSRWAPPDERSKFVSFSVIGLYIGNIIAFVIAGWMLEQWDWSWLFYVSGAATLGWYGIWVLVVSNDPADDKHITEEERDYIKGTLNSVSANEKLAYPMKEILTCMPFWAGCLAKFSFGCGITFTTLFLPQYIKDTNDIDIKKIGYISTIPQICSIISMPLSGYMSDYIRSNKILSVTNLHKLNMSLGFFTAFVVFLIPGKWPSFFVSMVCISTYQFFSTFVTVDVQVLVLDLAPKYAAFLNSISNVFFTTSGIVTPALVGFIVTTHSKEQWDICFYVFSGIHFLVGLIFLEYGSGDLQPWANYTGKRVQPVENRKEYY